MGGIVTENDLRQEKWRDVDVNDLEFRADGQIVRKDRFVTGMRDIAYMFIRGRDYEIPEVIKRVKALVDLRDGIEGEIFAALWTELKTGVKW